MIVRKDSLPGAPNDEAYRAALTRAGQAIAAIPPVLAHLVGAEPMALFNDAAVACTRGMVDSLALKLVRECDAGAVEPQDLADLTARLASLPQLLRHCHALAIESRTAERLAASGGADLLLPPLLQDCIASERPELAATGMSLLAAQARFTLAQRRMELPLAELPAELLHEILVVLEQSGLSGANAAAAQLRALHGEANARVALLARVALMLEGGLDQALRPERSGIAMFVSALSLAAGVERDVVALALAEGQEIHLATLLAAASDDSQLADAALLHIHVDLKWPSGLNLPGVAEARALLAEEAGL